MNSPMQQFCKGLDRSVDKVRKLSKNFCEPLGVTTFGYVRVYDNGSISWVTSNPDQDRFLIESGALKEDPLLDTPKNLKEGQYLWFHDRKFPGYETFYHDRARLFHMDHGMVVVQHQKNYLETCCFSGLLKKRPLYNLFMNEKALFSAFLEYFTSVLDHSLLTFLKEGLSIADIKSSYEKPHTEDQFVSSHRSSLLIACGWKNLLKLSKRERECLLLVRQGYSYQAIGDKLQLSARTIEHYIESVKNKLDLETRSELYQAAEKLIQLKI